MTHTGPPAVDLDESSSSRSSGGQLTALLEGLNLSLIHICIVRQDVGANYARTLSMDVETGTVKVRSYGRPEIIL